MDLAQLTAWIREYARVIGENAQFLTDLDAAIGDADHGINMDRGMTAVISALDEAPPADMSALCKQVGMTLVKSVGGASGPLYGTFFLRMAGALGAGQSVDGADFAKALRRRRGRGAAWPCRSRRQDDVRRTRACARRARHRAGIRLQSGRRTRRRHRSGRKWPRRHRIDGCPQGASQLSGATQRRPRGSGRDIGGHADRRRRVGVRHRWVTP